MLQWIWGSSRYLFHIMVLFHLKNTQKWIFFLGTSTILHSGCNNLQSHHQSTSVEAMRWAWGLGLRKCAVSLNLCKSSGAAGAGGAFWVGLAPGMSGLLKSTGESWEGDLDSQSAPTSRTYYGLSSWDPARRHLGPLQTPNHVRGLSSWEPSEVRESKLGFHVSVKCSLLLLPGSRYLFPCRLPGPRGGLKAFVWIYFFHHPQSLISVLYPDSAITCNPWLLWKYFSAQRIVQIEVGGGV